MNCCMMFECFENVKKMNREIEEIQENKHREAEEILKNKHRVMEEMIEKTLKKHCEKENMQTFISESTDLIQLKENVGVCDTEAIKEKSDVKSKNENISQLFEDDDIFNVDNIHILEENGSLNTVSNSSKSGGEETFETGIYGSTTESVAEMDKDESWEHFETKQTTETSINIREADMTLEIVNINKVVSDAISTTEPISEIFYHYDDDAFKCDIEEALQDVNSQKDINIVQEEYKFKSPENKRVSYEIDPQKACQHENTLNVGDDSVETDEEIVLLVTKNLMGEEIKPEVIRMASNSGFIVYKTEALKIIFKKDKFCLSWWHHNGTVRLQWKSRSRSYKPCSVTQFINILKNPEEPEEAKVKKKLDVKTKIKSEIKFPNTFMESNLKINNHKKPFQKSCAAVHFDNQHINGNHDPRKPVNSIAKFDEEEYIVLRVSGNPEAIPKGAKYGQKLFLTKNKVAYKNSGLRNQGETGEVYFVVAGKHLEDEKKVAPEHLGVPTIREDGKVVYYNELLSQCLSQATQKYAH